MKNILFYSLFITTFCFSQNSDEIKNKNIILNSQKDSLLIKKKNIEKQISNIENKIESNLAAIKILDLKNNSVKATLKRDCSFYKDSNSYALIIDFPKKKTEIYLVEYYQNSSYFKAIYNEKIGLIKDKDLRHNKYSKELKIKSKNNNHYSNYIETKKPPKKTSYKSKRIYSKRYYQGPRGGCYYINSNGNKSYVSRSLCK